MAIRCTPRAVAMLVAVLTVSQGCAHSLEIKNLSSYQTTAAEPLRQRVGIGVAAPSPQAETQQIAKAIGAELGKYGADVAYPYGAVAAERRVDVVATIDVQPTHDGSGWNFLVNFPGFLIFAPAWHGYLYEVKYDVNITLSSPVDGAVVDRFAVPVVLDVRHASINRTWTEISWLEVGAIAFISGLVFTSYDDGVTPLVLQHSTSTVGDYVAQQIVARMNATARARKLEQPTAATEPPRS
jgi:hypothetical protein